MKFPSDWHLAITPKHWSNEETMGDYIDKIIVPYVEKKRKDLQLPSDFPALVLFDHFSGQVTNVTFDKLEKNHIMYVLVPKTCTDRLQPMDLSINKPIKDCLKHSFQAWYASQIEKQIQQNPDSPVTPVDFRLSIIKPLHAQWLIDTYDYIKSRPEIIVNGFKAAGIFDKIGSS